ncbi:FAD/NAD(P)-binding domain-containing protein [Poronia punctata]|nr:FAD/NAD(P)-binding domain-containing protein [Poronia punctata]
MSNPAGNIPPTGLSIVVIGGGLCGVASALALRKSGHRVTVLERSPELREIGAGIQLPPNATRLLQKWGVLDDVRKLANEPVEGALRSWRGTVITRPPQGPAVERAYQVPFLVVHRADLLNVLVEAALKQGVEIKLGCDVAAVDFATSTVRLSTGVTYKADLILGADGERSVCRNELLGRQDLPRSTGDKVVRIVVSRGDITKDHPSWELVQKPSVNVWMGPGAHAVSYLLRGETLNVVLVHTDDSEAPVMYGPQPIDLHHVKSYFAGWDPVVQGLLDAPHTFCSQWTLLHIDEVADWSHQNGSFLLIGDAAHAMLPYMAQGAAQAFEDAGVLGAIFSSVTDKRQVPEAVEVFKRVRQPRVARVRQATLAQQAMNKLADGPLQEGRDRQLAQSTGTTQIWDWLWGYDAVLDGERAWQDYTKSSGADKE